MAKPKSKMAIITADALLLAAIRNIAVSAGFVPFGLWGGDFTWGGRELTMLLGDIAGHSDAVRS
ncbi:hypothetical protein [Novipirellula caenicola]|uniref:Uncharacterized protein n=1 Tax=Novipirellula caenicola TaxID=1536901 RepID=A0ABP9VWP7_9BACT